MKNKEIFENYITNNELPKKILTEFNKLEKNILTPPNKNNISNFRILSCIIKNFGNIEEKTIDFKTNTLSLFGLPNTNKTATLEAIIFAIYGQNKTLKRINSIDDNPTLTSIDIKIGLNMYTINRRVKSGATSGTILINGVDRSEQIGGIKDINLYVESLIGINYDLFNELLYSGDISLPLTLKKQIEIKQLFVNLIDSEYWNNMHDLSLEKQRKLEHEIAALEGAESVVKRIANGVSISDLKLELKSIIKTLPSLKKEIDSLKSRENYSDKLSELSDNINILKKDIVDEDFVYSSIKNNTSQLNVIGKDGNILFKEIGNIDNEISHLEHNASQLKISGENLNGIIGKAQKGICPIIKVNCNIIKENVTEYEERLISLRKKYVDLNKEVKKKRIIKSEKIKKFEKITGFEFNLDEDFISKVVKNIENENIDLEKQLKSSISSNKKLSILEKKYKEIQNIIVENSSNIERATCLAGQYSELQARNSTINNILSEVSGVEEKVNLKTKKEKEVLTYKTISDITQRNKIPKIEALTYKTKVETKIKSFCKDLLPFKSFKFDNQFILHLDEKPISLLNSATKKIVNLAFRFAISSIYSKKIPLFIIDDIGDSLSDSLTNKLINKIKSLGIVLFIYTSNRENLNEKK